MTSDKVTIRLIVTLSLSLVSLSFNFSQGLPLHNAGLFPNNARLFPDKARLFPDKAGLSLDVHFEAFGVAAKLLGIDALDGGDADLVGTFANDGVVHIDGGGATGEPVEEEIEASIVDGEVTATTTEVLVAGEVAERFETSGVLGGDADEVHVAVSCDDVADSDFVAYLERCGEVEIVPCGGACLLHIKLALDLEFVGGVELEVAHVFEEGGVGGAP